MKHIFAIWILLVITVSCVLGVVYLVVQQEMRIGANDLQIQIAEDTAKALDNLKQITFSQESIDISRSLSPFVMTFNTNGVLRSSEGVLDGKSPSVPSGVFIYTKEHGEDRLTWQPKEGVRIAAVVVSYRNGYVLVGRNIREVEKREDMLLQQIIVGWMATVAIIFIASLVFLPKKQK